ncbi:UNVERIFIED_CONTAM: hypothetical protein Sangu_0420000 [Sesamum angustifolium]|uniref:C2H2-type domain-containing protein n=1 Tax=Sesamum angustifolium TaxID=2727405 RepID=A0AAW2QTI9_9LAMI
MEPGASSSSRTPIPQNGVERAPESSRSAKGKAPAVTPTKQYFCSNCRKKFDSYFALGGHRAYHVRETRRWWGHQPSWAAMWYGQQWVPPNYEENVHVHQEQHGCPWCNRSFTTRQGLSAHSRFCRMRRQQEENQKPAAGRDFDLNQLPPEAFLPEELLRLTWH